MAGQGDLTQPYFADGKKDQRGAAKKGLSIVRFGIFQTRPHIVRFLSTAAPDFSGAAVPANAAVTF
nr:hypothetical protein [uncultured Oscillibacter sp.]